MLAEGASSIVRDEPVRSGVAMCPHVHQWPARWFMRIERVQAKYGTYPNKVRIVDPECCPVCGERWDQVEELP